MRLFNRFIWSLSVGMVLASVACTNINENIGSEYMRDDQETLIKYKLFNGAVPSLTDEGAEESLFLYSKYIDTDFNYANISYGTTGSQYTENFGKRVSGFYSQYTPAYELESTGFGTSPVISALAFYLSAAEYSGDTTVVRKYNVYMALDDSFLDDKYTFTSSEAETLFGDVANDSNFVKVFSFQYPDQANGVYTNSSAIVLYNSGSVALTTAFENETTGVSVTDAGITLLKRLMLKYVYGYEQLTYESYDFDNHDDFIEQFKGFYIEVEGVENDDLGSGNSGATYSHLLSECGFGFSGYETQSDWTEAILDEEVDGYTDIDMIAMIYSFDDEYTSYGRNSINYVVRSEQPTVDTTDENHVYIESLGGRVTDMRISKSFFEWMENEMDVANDSEEHTFYKNIFFSRASVYAYIPYMTDYELVTDISSIDDMTTQMNTYQQRIGMYELYTNTYDDDDEHLIEAVLDYDVVSEAYYGTVSNFNGYINRTLGRYEMNIQHQMQIMWDEWCDLENKDTITDEEWNALDWNRVHLAPVTSNFAAVRYVTLQGYDNNAALPSISGAPMQLDVIYTLRK